MASSEGEAIGIATGYYLATGKIPIVYMQNDGLCNAMNPLTSLCDRYVYGIPMILFIGWRGTNDDAIQHQRMGEILKPLLDLLGIKHSVIKKVDDVREAKRYAQIQSEPRALIFERKVFEKRESREESEEFDSSPRENMMDIILNKISGFSVVATTGKTSRELYELREKRGEPTDDFLMIGSMGCAASIGLGIAVNEKPVCIFDGDGAVLMKMGTLATIGYYKPLRFIHILFDNESYASTGGQATVSRNVNWKMLFMSVGYFDVYEISSIDELKEINFSSLTMPTAIVVKVSPYARKNLKRPTKTLKEIKDLFMKKL